MKREKWDENTKINFPGSILHNPSEMMAAVMQRWLCDHNALVDELEAKDAEIRKLRKELLKELESYCDTDCTPIGENECEECYANTRIIELRKELEE